MLDFMFVKFGIFAFGIALYTIYHSFTFAMAAVDGATLRWSSAEFSCYYLLFTSWENDIHSIRLENVEA